MIVGWLYLKKKKNKSKKNINLVPFFSGRTDATQEETEVDSVAFLELKSDGFRNFDGGDAANRRPGIHYYYYL